MRKIMTAFCLACAVLATSVACAADGFDFGDMPPLPPPLLDDAPPAPPLSTGGPSGGLQPLTPPSAPVAPQSPLAPPAAPLAPVTPAADLLSTPLAPPPLAPDGGAAGLPDTVGQPAPGAPGAPAAVAEAPAPLIPETPRPGRVSGGRVNVRAGPNTQYESIAVLTTGSPVTVLAKNNEWYKIVFPADQLASIHKNFVDAEITGEIPEAGLPGVVNQDNADIHAFYWDRSTVVGKLNKGDPVVIRQERGQWYRINAPETARAYVFAEYVKLDGQGEVAQDTAPAPVNPAVDLTAGTPDGTGRLKLSENDRRAAALKEAYFKRLQENQVRQEEEAAQQVSELQRGLDDLEARLNQINQETANLYTYAAPTTVISGAGWAPPDPMFGGYYGWIENIGRVGGAPASFRLTKGGEIRYFLRSDRFSLNDYVGRRVWINGNIEPASGAVANVLNVDQIRILTDLEIAESMRASGQPLASDPLGQPLVVDSYGYGASSGDPFYGTPGYVPAPNGPQMIPSDPSQLPDVVGYGMGGGGGGGSIGYMSSPGEVDSDFFENPIISEIGP